MSKVTSAAGSALGGMLAGSTGNLLGELKRPTSSEISINGEGIAKAKNKGGSISTSYNMNADDKALYDYTRQNLLSGLENVNVFSPEVQSSINKQLEAYKNQGLKNLQESYEPMFRDLQNNIAQRFGNLDNSVFMDNLNALEKNRTNALETLTENIMAKQSELYQQELDNRYKYLSQVSGINQNLNNNMFKILQLAMSGLN